MTTMTIPSPAAKKFRVHDQLQVLEFEGQLIGEATTETPKSPRWTEIRIYKTRASSYVVERVGVSLVYHRADALCASGFNRSASDVVENDTRELEACERCTPPDIYAANANLVERIKVETNRNSASVVPASGLVDALTLTRPNGSTYLSNVATAALTDAIGNDPDLAEILTTRTYVP